MQDEHLKAVRAAAQRVDETLADSMRAIETGDVTHAEPVHDDSRASVDYKNATVKAAIGASRR